MLKIMQDSVLQSVTFSVIILYQTKFFADANS